MDVNRQSDGIFLPLNLHQSCFAPAETKDWIREPEENAFGNEFVYDHVSMAISFGQNQKPWRAVQKMVFGRGV